MEAVSSSSSGGYGPHTAQAAEFRGEMSQRLAEFTRRIRWKYSIFWSFDSKQQVLKWREGYVDGTNSIELNLRRSQQLRNLYNAMDGSGALGQPSSSSSEMNITSLPILAPKDLTPLEWFYIGSMVVLFASGDGLPGQAFARRGHVWHCIASQNDSRVLVRAHLVQKARLQTIVCIPALDGVLEIGTTALVEQDPNLLHQMQSLLLEQPMQQLTRRTSSGTRTIGQARESGAATSGAMMVTRTSASGFQRWTAAMAEAAAPPLPKHRQQMLKAAVITLPRLYAAGREVHVEDFSTRATSTRTPSEVGYHSRGLSGQSKHVLAERRRREQLNKRFDTLRQLVPFNRKPNKESLLGDAIEYVRELERQVRELESTAKKSSQNPMKQDVDVTIQKNMAILKISCAWQDDLLIEILQKTADLQLEVVDANAEVSKDTFNATLKAKVRSSDRGNEEVKTAEIQAALHNLIEGKLRGKAVVQ